MSSLSGGITAVVFDLGKVLLEFDYGRLIQKITSHCAYTEEELHGLINQSPLLYQFETGLLTSAEFYREIKRSAGFKGDERQFVNDFGDIFTPIPEMIELNEVLRSTGVETFIFSNTNEIAIAHIRQKYPFFKNFTGYFFSFEERLMKPAPQLYRNVELRLARFGKEILYIDDRTENVEAGKAAGWDSILHESPRETWRQVRDRIDLPQKWPGPSV
jgi:HAD superfamily hydrolase (TIGR01509 family)